MRLSTKISLVVFIWVTVAVVWSGVIFVFWGPDFFPTSKGRLTLIFFSFVTGVPAVVIIWLVIMKRIVYPIISLNQTAKIIASGNLGKRVEIDSTDEIGQLGQSLNTMVKNLVSAFQGMADSLRLTKEKEGILASNVVELQKARQTALQAFENLKEEKVRLEEAKAKDEALLSSIGDGVVAIDSSGQIIFANKEAEAMFETKIEDMVGHPWREIILLRDIKNKQAVSEGEQIVNQALSAGAKVTGSYYCLHKDQTIFPVAVTAAPIRIDEVVIGIVAVFRDITREKEIDRMKTEFISLASHQLRTPLSAIRWFTELLLDGSSGELTEEQKKLAENVNLSAARMVELVNSLLNISRIESGKIIIDPQPTDLVELVRGIAKELEGKIREKEQNLVISAHEQLPKISIDPKLIRQVYLNLLTNAIKYTPQKGEVVIFISRKNDQIISQVSDNGFGIPLKDQPKVFEKFYRASNVVKVEPDGSGLGLYLVKAIIESSKGQIWFQSEEGKGTTFWFSLPLAGVSVKVGEVALDS